jgi:hypothetical protein
MKLAVNGDTEISQVRLSLTKRSGSESIVSAPFVIYSNGSRTELSINRSIKSMNGTLTASGTTAISGSDGKVHYLPVESFEWILPSVGNGRTKATTATGKFQESLSNKSK